MPFFYAAVHGLAVGPLMNSLDMVLKADHLIQPTVSWVQ